MSRKEKIITAIVAVITIATVVGVTVFAIIRSNNQNPDVPITDNTVVTPPDSQTTKPDDTDIPPIQPPKDGTDFPDDSTTAPDEDEIRIDVDEPVVEEREEEPHIVGDVSIIPGVKEGDGE